MDPKELDELTGVTGEAEEVKEEQATSENQESEGEIQLNDDKEKEQPGSTPGKKDDSAIKAEEKQAEVDAAHKQHEETGTWPDGTPQWVKNRVNKLTQQKYDREQTIKKYEQENLDLKRKLAEVKEPEPVVSERPNIDDFDSEDAYFEALIDWKGEVSAAAKAKEAKEAKPIEQGENEQVSDSAEIINFEERRQSTVSKGSEKYEDFMEKVKSVPAELFNANVVDAFTMADNPEDVAYYLATDLTELERIAHLSGARMAIEIGKISARLDNGVEKHSEPSKPPPRKTKAPDPINPIGGGRVSTGQIPDDSMEVLEKVLARR